MTLVYFSWIREKIGKSSETIDLPKTVTTVGALLDHLRQQGPKYAQALQTQDQIKVAINHNHARLTDLVDNNDEVALFPPITGG